MQAHTIFVVFQPNETDGINGTQTKTVGENFRNGKSRTKKMKKKKYRTDFHMVKIFNFKCLTCIKNKSTAKDICACSQTFQRFKE